METRQIDGEVASSAGTITRNTTLHVEAFTSGIIGEEASRLGPIIVTIEGQDHDCLFSGLHISGMRPVILLRLELPGYMGYIAITLQSDGEWRLEKKMALAPKRHEVAASAIWAALGL